MKFFLRYLLAIILIAGIAEAGVAQKEHRKRARTAIKELKKGILIVTIPTFQKKIDMLKSLIKREAHTRKRLYLEEELAKAKQGRDLAPNQIKESFRLHYDFSAVLFIDDTASTHLKKGNYENIIFDTTAINLKEQNFFVHKPSVLQTSNLARIAIVDKHFVPLEPPFPHVIRIHYSIKDYYYSKYTYVFGERYVKALNKEFWNYYESADRKKWWHLFTREWKE